MTACSCIGRVGGLAIALGVGAAAFNGSAVAWANTGADAPSVESSAAVDSGSQATNARQSRPAGRTVSRATVRSGGKTLPSPAAAKSPTKVALASAAQAALPTSVAVDPVADSDAPLVAAPAPDVANVRPAAAPAAAEPAADAIAALPEAAPVTPVPAPQSAAVSGVVTAVASPVSDPFANGNPAAPADSPLAWTVAAVTRRASAVAQAASAASAPAATQPVILGPSGVPIPPDWYVAKVMQYYMPAGANAPQVVFTPEGLYPITGVKSLPLNTSVDQGLTILSDTLNLLPAGTATTMFGYSQSAIIGSLMQSGFNNTPVPAGVKDSINFVFVGNEMNPNGGFLSRFPRLNLPSLGIPFYGPTPENAYPTTNYTLEYDGFGDFPRYPLNFLADLNAALGIVYVHTKYTPAPDCTSFCTTLQQVQDAIVLPTTSPTEKFFFMPTQNLPLLEPLRALPLIGNPIADLIQPVLKVIVDLAYADPAHGFASAVQPDANVLVPFGLFPKVSASEVFSRLAAGFQQGLKDFGANFGPQGSFTHAISAMATSSQAVTSIDGLITKLQGVISAVSNWVSGSASSLYAALLPTADIANAILVSLPAYDANLVLEGVKQMLGGQLIQGLVNAIGLPVAADVGLVTTASLVGLLVWAQAVQGVL